VVDVGGGVDPNAGVDLDTCAPHGAGQDSLCGVWEDPAFDPNQPAFYYARIIENPTCRWSQKLCAANRVRCDEPESVPVEFAACCDPDHRRTIRERAWTSPIWFRPDSAAGGSLKNRP
jgi:hypothetical protein